MSTLQFPKNPAINDEYDWEGFKYVYDGQKWKTIGVGYNPVNDLKDKLEPRIDELEDDVTHLQSGNSSLVQAVNALNVRVTAEEEDTKDWEVFTAELLAQAGIVDDGQPDEIGNSKRVDALNHMFTRKFSSTDEMVNYQHLSEDHRYSTGGTIWEYTGGEQEIASFISLTQVNVRDFGAKGDGLTDDTQAIQDAIDYAYSKKGVVILIPQGQYLVTRSLDMTYAGSASGTDSAYYSIAITGTHVTGCEIVGDIDNRPIFDMTGSGRALFRDLFIGSRNPQHKVPSCGVLTARNLTNSGAGGNVFTNIHFGFYLKFGVMSISSEVNEYYNCKFQLFTSGAVALALMEQNEFGIVSDYIDLSGHVFSGGNTSNQFFACHFNSFTSGTSLVAQNTDTTSFFGCYATAPNSPHSVLLKGTNSSAVFSNLRVENTNTKATIVVEANGKLINASMSGRVPAGIRGEDGSDVSDCDFALTISGDVNLFSARNNNFKRLTGSLIVRNKSEDNTLGYNRTEASVTNLPSDAQNNRYIIQGIGGKSKFKYIKHSESMFDVNYINRIVVNRLQFAQTTITNPSTSQPIDLSNGGVFSVLINKNVTFANPLNAFQLGDAAEAGAVIKIVMQNDSVGGYTVGFGSYYNTGSFVYNKAANAINIISFVAVSLPLGGLRFIAE